MGYIVTSSQFKSFRRQLAQSGVGNSKAWGPLFQCRNGESRVGRVSPLRVFLFGNIKHTRNPMPGNKNTRANYKNPHLMLVKL
jgi:hypothetical protein